MGSVQVLVDLDFLMSFLSGCGLLADHFGPLGWISVVAVVV